MVQPSPIPRQGRDPDLRATVTLSEGAGKPGPVDDSCGAPSQERCHHRREEESEPNIKPVASQGSAQHKRDQ